MEILTRFVAVGSHVLKQLLLKREFWHDCDYFNTCTIRLLGQLMRPGREYWCNLRFFGTVYLPALNHKTTDQCWKVWLLIVKLFLIIIFFNFQQLCRMFFSVVEKVFKIIPVWSFYPTRLNISKVSSNRVQNVSDTSISFKVGRPHSLPSSPFPSFPFSYSLPPFSTSAFTNSRYVFCRSVRSFFNSLKHILPAKALWTYFKLRNCGWWQPLSDIVRKHIYGKCLVVHFFSSCQILVEPTIGTN